VLIWRCFRHGPVHRSWPKRIVLEDDTSAVITGAGNGTSDPHLAPSPDVARDSFLVIGRQLLLDLTRVTVRYFPGELPIGYERDRGRAADAEASAGRYVRTFRLWMTFRDFAGSSSCFRD
jgi:hypothetical protein